MAAFFRQFSFPEGVPATAPRRHPAHFTKAANLVTRFAAARVRRDIRQSGLTVFCVIGDVEG
jgi:hypothetical protein